MRVFQKVRAKVHLARDDWRYFGPGAGARNLSLWAMRKISTYRVAIIYGAEVSQLASLAQSRPNYRFAMEPTTHIPESLLDAADIRTTDSVDIFVMRSDSEIAFVAKVADHSFTIPKRHVITIPNQDVYISCCYTSPVFRGRGLYALGISQIALLHRSAKNAFLYVESENNASTRAVLKMGFRPLAKSMLLSCGPFTSRKFTTFDGSPFVDVRSVQEA